MYSTASARASATSNRVSATLDSDCLVPRPTQKRSIEASHARTGRPSPPSPPPTLLRLRAHRLLAHRLQLRPTRPLPTRPTPSMHFCLPSPTMTRPTSTESPLSPTPFMGGRCTSNTHTLCSAPISAPASSATCAMPPTHPDSDGGATPATTTSATFAGCARSRPTRATLSQVRRHTDGS